MSITGSRIIGHAVDEAVGNGNGVVRVLAETVMLTSQRGGSDMVNPLQTRGISIGNWAKKGRGSNSGENLGRAYDLTGLRENNCITTPDVFRIEVCDLNILNDDIRDANETQALAVEHRVCTGTN